MNKVLTILQSISYICRELIRRDCAEAGKKNSLRHYNKTYQLGKRHSFCFMDRLIAYVDRAHKKRFRVNHGKDEFTSSQLSMELKAFED